MAILGYGQFGQFMSAHLSTYVDVCVYNRTPAVVPETIKCVDIDEACAADIVIFSVPMSAFQSLCELTKEKIPTSSIIVDVTSVKVPPLTLLKKYFPTHQILGTHPIFGPQSGKDGIEGLPIVLTQISLETHIYDSVKDFLRNTLKLSVIEATAEEHDKAMAHVQGLTHFIGRAITEMQITDTPLATQSYKQLLELVRLVGSDSWELFSTIENENQYAAPARKSFLETLQSLEERLQNK